MRIVLLILTLLCGHAAAAEVAVPELRQQVTDLTGTLSSADISALTQQVQKLAPAQVAVLVVPTTGDDTIEQFATRVFDKWKLGDKQRSDGVLLLVAWQDHTVRIEVGYGLEGALTDVQSGQIIRNAIIPAFRQDRLAQGLQQGVEQIGKLLAGEQLPSEQPRTTSGSHDEERPPLEMLVVGLFALTNWIFRRGNVFARGIKSGVTLAVVAWLWSLFFTASSLPLLWIIAIAFGGSALAMLLMLLGALGLFRGGGGGFRGGGGSGGGGFRGGGGSSGGGGASGRW